MRVTVAVLVRGAGALAIASESIAGRPWIVRMVERMRTARCVDRVVVLCTSDASGADALFAGAAVEVIEFDGDPMRAAATLTGTHDGVVLVPVEQYFADPARLDAGAETAAGPGVARVLPVLASDPYVPLQGGAFVDIITRAGLLAAADGHDLDGLSAARWPAEPEPPEMRLRSYEDIAWTQAAAARLVDDPPLERFEQFERLLVERGLSRFPFWDSICNPPRRILTIRCLPGPLFAHVLRYLARLGAPTIDVVCSAALAAETSALPGVHDVITFEAPSFSVDGLGATLARIRAARYDLCVLPRRERTGRGLDNITPLGAASGASTAIWLDVFGESGLLHGAPQGWDDTSHPAPHADALAYARRASRALAEFAPVIAASSPAPAPCVDPSGSLTCDHGELLVELTARMDEHVNCHGLLDNPDAGIDLSAFLLYQQPDVASIRRDVARLRATGHAQADALTGAVDALFVSLVAAVSIPPPADRSRLLAPALTEAIATLARTLATLSPDPIDQVA